MILSRLQRLGCTAAVGLTLSLAGPLPALAHNEASQLSALSALPVALSVAAPVAVLSAGTTLTLRTVEASGRGTTWVLERGSDGARASLQFAGQASVASGTAITVSAVAAGWVLSADGRALALVPNEIGRALMHDERISP